MQDNLGIPFGLPLWILWAVGLFLYFANRKVHPIRQREPVLCMIGATCSVTSAIVGMFRGDSYYGYFLPCIVDTASDMIAVGFCLAIWSIRTWKLYYSYKLTEERNENRLDGWFSRHVQSFGTKQFITKISCILFIFHSTSFIVVILSYSMSGIDLTKQCLDVSWGRSSFMGVLAILYTVFIIRCGFKLRKVEENFFYKLELKVSGLLSILFTIMWFFAAGLNNFNSSFPYDQFFGGWLVGLTAIVSSFLLPLWKASKEPDFTFHVKERTRFEIDFSLTQIPQHHSGSSVAETNSSNNAKTENSTFSLLQVLKDSACCEAFRNFIVKVFAVENLIFLQEVEAFKYLCSSYAHDQSEKIKEANRIYDKFISEESPMQINIGHAQVLNIERELKHPVEGVAFYKLFDEAYRTIVQMLERDCFRRFKFSPEFQSIESTVQKKSVYTMEDISSI